MLPEGLAGKGWVIGMKPTYLLPITVKVESELHVELLMCIRVVQR